MNLKSRIKKLESNTRFNPPCFCGKTLVAMWFGKQYTKPLTYCHNCKQQFDAWANLAAEAKVLIDNQTDKF